MRVPLPLWWQLVIQRDAKPLLGLPQLQESWNGKVAVYGCVLVVVLFFFFFVAVFV